jgi:hypothetical protein
MSGWLTAGCLVAAVLLLLVCAYDHGKRSQ